MALKLSGAYFFMEQCFVWSIDGIVDKADRTVNMQFFEENGWDKQVLYQCFDDRKYTIGYLVVYEGGGELVINK